MAFFDLTNFKAYPIESGKSSYGTSYIIEAVTISEKYFAKAINFDKDFTGNEPILLVQESTILSEIDHPSIVKFKGLNFKSLIDPNILQLTIITDFLNNNSLRSNLNKLTPTQKCITLLGICSAMRYLHNLGIKHFNLKLENILFDSQNQPYVSDYYLTKFFPKIFHKTVNLTIEGESNKPIYLPPEIVRGEKNDDPSFDVYSFSMIAYEIVTGKVPFSELGEIVSPIIMKTIISNKYRPPFTEEVTENMKTLISRCWNESKEERPSFKEIFNELSHEPQSYFKDKLEECKINEYLKKLNEVKEIESQVKCCYPSLEHFKVLASKDDISKKNEYVLIPYNMTDNFCQTNFLDSSELKSCINDCSEIMFEIQYPSSNYTNIYQNVINLKQNNSEKVKIAIFYTKLEITDDYFAKNKEINYVRFDSCVTSIGESAFSECSSLTQIIIPSSVTSIRNSTFSGCSSLKQIAIPSSVTSIGSSSFYGCSSLTKITIPSSVTSIGSSSFYGCSSLKQIAIPSSVTSIGSSSFRECRSLTQITIPSSVTSIGSSSFYVCSSLTQITIPSSVTSIGSSSFGGCYSLTQITIPSSVASIGSSSFSGCYSLIQITIPSSVTSIGDYTFCACSSLIQITIPSSVTLIGNGAFERCSSITQITIPSSVTLIGNGAFQSCTSIEQITIPSSVTSIGGFAFCACSSLKQITIPSSVKSIGKGAFCNCSSLKQITIPSLFKHDKLLNIFNIEYLETINDVVVKYI